jgi:hypothetical protein
LRKNLEKKHQEKTKDFEHYKQKLKINGNKVVVGRVSEKRE